MKTTVILIAFIALFLIAPVGHSATWYVPDDFPTIQGAISDPLVLDGDTIVVRPNTYVENIDFRGKAITVTSSDGASLTVIDGNQSGCVVTFQSGETNSAVLDGFKITNGYSALAGGIYCDGASPTIINNIITKNADDQSRAPAIRCYFSSPMIINNIISYNKVIGIYCDYSDAVIINNTIYGNWAWWYGGHGIYCNESSPIVTNSILWDNGWPEIHVRSGNPTVTYCDVLGGWPGTGNIRMDPLFIDPDNNDFHLPLNSPCIDVGDSSIPGLPSTDFEGDPRICDGNCDGSVVVDMGCDEVSPLNVPFEYATIQSALNAAVDEDIILVAPGTYSENIDFLGKAVSLISLKGLDVTVIDGTQMGSVVTFANNEGVDSLITGFTITNGCALRGGGIYCSGASPAIRENKIIENLALAGDGGGIYCLNANPLIQNNTIRENKSDLRGGGIHCEYSFPKIEDNGVHENKACSGGGISCLESSPEITHNILSLNSGKSGGGIFCQNNSNPTIKNNAIVKNAASEGDGGGICCEYSAPAVVKNTFSQNSATGKGGVIQCHESSPMIQDNLIYMNTAGFGGAVSARMNSMPVLLNNMLYENSASSGGGIYSSKDSQPIITNNTLYGNTASVQGGGMDCGDGSPLVRNSIFWRNKAPTGSQIHGTNPQVTCSDIQGGWPGAGNINEEPLFMDSGIKDFRLTLDSPCMDKGDASVPELPEEDFEGDPRIDYVFVDMGADEYYLGGKTIYVPDFYLTIQGAIDAAVDGDTILVRSGTYVENIDFKGKPITVTSEQGADVTVIDGNQSGSVVACDSGEGPDSVLDGFTITNGSASSGGGMYNEGGNPTMTNCIFTGNSATNGGGMYNHMSSPTVTNCTFTGNSATNGGGIDNLASNPTVTNCTFTGNSAIYGGGIKGNQTVINCTFTGNSAAYGGGMYNGGIVTNCTLTGNSATSVGGGMYSYNSSPTVTNCIFTGNSADYWGGGMGHRGSSPTVTNCTFSGNSAVSWGGGMGNGDSSPTLTNTIFWNNDAPKGPEIWMGYILSSSTLTISYSDVKGGKASVYVDPGCSLNWGPGMIDADPLFVDPANGDCHITFPSPCKDTGENSAVTESTDFEGDPRIAYGTVDMGVDEFYTHLYWTGDATPGGNMSLRFIGLPGTSPVQLWLGSGVMNPPMQTKYGAWYLQYPLLAYLGLGAISSEGVLVFPFSLPAGIPTPLKLPFQGGIGMELTNLCVMDVY